MKDQLLAAEFDTLRHAMAAALRASREAERAVERRAAMRQDMLQRVVHTLEETPGDPREVTAALLAIVRVLDVAVANVLESGGDR